MSAPKVDLEVAGSVSRAELEQLAGALDAALRLVLPDIGPGLAAALGAGWVTTFEVRNERLWLFTADPMGAPPVAERLRGPVVVHGDRTWLFLLRDGERAVKPVVVSGGSSLCATCAGAGRVALSGPRAHPADGGSVLNTAWLAEATDAAHDALLAAVSAFHVAADPDDGDHDAGALGGVEAAAAALSAARRVYKGALEAEREAWLRLDAGVDGIVVAPLDVKVVGVPAVAYEAALELLRDLRDHPAFGSPLDAQTLYRLNVVELALDYADPAAQARALELLQARAERGGGA